MTIQTEVLIETLKALNSDFCLCYCKKIYTQDHTVAIIMPDGSGAFPPWKGESFGEYWYCILDALIYPEDDGNGHISYLFFDDGGDMNILIHEGKNVEDLFLKDGTIPDTSPAENS